MGDGARISHEPGSLIGRDDDLEYLTAFADQAAVSGGAPLLSGEAGVEVSFAGLNQLLGPMQSQSQSQS